MALGANKGANTLRPILGGLALVSGSAQLITLRWLLIIISSLPALAGIFMAVSGAARRPYFTGQSGRLPGVHLMQLAQELPPLLVALGLAAILIALLGQQLLMAGALAWLGPRGASAREGAVCSAVIREGTSWIWTMLRVVITAAALGALGISLLGGLFEWLGLHGERAGWTGRTLLTVLPLLKGLGIATWLALVGSWAFWCRVVLVGDGRRLVRSAGVIALRVLVRFPVRGGIFCMVLTSSALLLASALLILWRQYPAATLPGVLAWQAAWLAGLLLQAAAWHWLVRAALLLYDSEELRELREEPDAPWGTLSALKRLAWWR